MIGRLREVRSFAPAPLWLICRNAARGHRWGKNGRLWATRAEAPRLYWALLIVQAVFTVELLLFQYWEVASTKDAIGPRLIRGRFNQCRRQFVFAAQHVVKLRRHC